MTATRTTSWPSCPGRTTCPPPRRSPRCAPAPSARPTSRPRRPRRPGSGPTLKDSGSALRQDRLAVQGQVRPDDGVRRLGVDRLHLRRRDHGDQRQRFGDHGHDDRGQGGGQVHLDRVPVRQPRRRPAVAGQGASSTAWSRPPATAKPSFNFLHVLLPHGPWHYTDTGRPYPYPAVGPGSRQRRRLAEPAVAGAGQPRPRDAPAVVRGQAARRRADQAAGRRTCSTSRCSS